MLSTVVDRTGRGKRMRAIGGISRGPAALIALAWAFMIFMAAPPVGAQTPVSDPFTVSDVRVDATAETGVEARGRAVAAGQRAAFEKLIERIVPESERGQIPQLTDPELSRLIVGYEVQEERTSGVRYLATLAFTFSEDQVKALLRNTGASFAAGPQAPVLVVPIFETGGRRVLWEEPNPWRQAWYGAPMDGLVPTAVPFGDIADIRDLSTGQALAGDKDALMRLAGRYGADGAVVVSLAPRPGGEAQITLRRVGSDGLGATLVETVALGEGVLEVDRLKPAVLRTIRLLEEEWRQDNLVQPGIETRLAVIVPIDGMERWIDIRRALDDAAVVARYEVLQLTRTMAAVDLYVNGSLETAEASLARRNLEFIDTYGGLVLRQFGQVIPFERRMDDGGAGFGSGVNAPQPEVLPGQPVPGQSAPGQSLPAQPAPGQSAPAPNVITTDTRPLAPPPSVPLVPGG